MAATVVSLPLPQPHEQTLSTESPAEARKRRRDILASHRNVVPSVDHSSAPAVDFVDSSGATAKKRRVMSSDLPLPAVVSPGTTAKKVVSSKVTGKAKKPQMKYDPDVPMTKEEAAVWRREQRRKRNRESAAASRQRQRDRIVELEAEVEDWKVKFDEAMKKIRQLEEAAGQSPDQSQEEPVELEESEPVAGTVSEPTSETLQIHSPEALVEEVFKNTILVSPSASPRSVSPTSSPVQYSQVEAVKVVSIGANQVEVEKKEEEPQPSKMISRPA